VSEKSGGCHGSEALEAAVTADRLSRETRCVEREGFFSTCLGIYF
jgi:hypothetical protein